MNDVSKKAIGLVELSSVAAGYLVADQMLKTAELKLLLNRTICSGKYMVLVAGDVASVRAGVDAATLLERFYQGILGREPDSGGVRLYLADMRRGQYASVLLNLIRSPEFERRLQR